MPNLKLVRPVLKAASLQTRDEINAYIQEVYQSHTNKTELKYLCSFILFVCCCVEESYSRKSRQNKKVDKKIEVLEHIATFVGQPLSESDKRIIEEIVEDLHSSKRIKRVSFIDKLVFTLGNFFFK
jgi:RecG-like helicase